MTDDAPLLPPVRLIHERLTRNQRERQLLRTLLRLAIRNSEVQPYRSPGDPLRMANGQEGVAR